jgi:hypothetical protein
VVEAAERVANVVQERADDVLLVATILMRQGRGLQRVRQPIDREAAVALEQSGAPARGPAG